MIKHNGLAITVTGGFNKKGEPERIRSFQIGVGTSIALVGPTGSGKSELLADIEQLAAGDSPSGRHVSISDSRGIIDDGIDGMVAQLSQKMSFIMDGSVERFLLLHAESRNKGGGELIQQTVDMANSLCGEPIRLDDPLHGLSGGQSRALMIADIALISDAPVVLIDEIENAGINKLKALSVLNSSNKPVVIATHDPLLILMADQRLIMKNGGMEKLLTTSEDEAEIFERLKSMDQYIENIRNFLRSGMPASISTEAVL